MIAARAPAAPQEQPGSALRERLAHVREQNEGHPLPGGAGALPVVPVVPDVPPKVMAVLYPLLASGRTSAAEAGLRLGVSKTTAYDYLNAMREYGYAEVVGSGRSSGFQLPERPEVPQDKRELVDNCIALSQYTTLEELAEAVHDGLVDADDDARSVPEQVRRIAGRKRLSVAPDPPDDGE